MANSKTKSAEKRAAEKKAASVETQSESSPTPTTSAVLGEALTLIDDKLGEVSMRELVSRTEFTDVLLDLRILLAAEAEALSSN